MKLIYMVILFSSMLFGMQKQIILGSYALDSNGQNAVQNAKEKIQNDEKLKTIMEKNSAKVMATKVSNYTVVSVNVFETYSDLLPAMEALKPYYKDAFSLNYPTNGFLEKDNFQMVVKKAKEEERNAKKVKATEEVKVVDTKQEIGVVEKILLAQASMLEKERLDKPEEEAVVKKIQRVPVYEIDYVEKKPMERTYTVIESESTLSQLDYNIIFGLTILVLLIGGFIIYNKVNKDETK